MALKWPIHSYPAASHSDKSTEKMLANQLPTFINRLSGHSKYRKYLRINKSYSLKSKLFHKSLKTTLNLQPNPGLNHPLKNAKNWSGLHHQPTNLSLVARRSKVWVSRTSQAQVTINFSCYKTKNLWKSLPLARGQKPMFFKRGTIPTW